MKFSIIFFSLSILFIASCKKDKPNEQKPKDEIVQEPLRNCIISHSSYLKYMYDADSNVVKLLKFDKDTSVTQPAYTLVYDVKKRVSKLKQDYTYGGYINYFYSNDDNIKSTEHYSIIDDDDPTLVLSHKNKYIYNTLGQIDSIIQYNPENWILRRTDINYDGKGNLLNYIVYDSTNEGNKPLYKYTYLYDDKRNSNFELPLNEVIGMAYSLSPNNVVYEKIEYMRVSQTEVTEKLFNYTYTKEGYPDKVDVKVTDGRFGISNYSYINGYYCK